MNNATNYKFIATTIILTALVFFQSLYPGNLLGAGIGNEADNTNYIFVNDKNLPDIVGSQKDLIYSNKSEIMRLKKTLSSSGKKLTSENDDPSKKNGRQWIIRKADYKGVVTKESARFDIKLEIVSFTDKAFDYYPPSDDIIIESARLDGKVVNLKLANQSPQSNQYSAAPWLTIKGKGTHNVHLGVIVPVSRFGNIASLTMTTERLPMANLELSVDEAYASIDLAPSTDLKISHPSKTRTVINSRLPVHNSIFVKWNQHSRAEATKRDLIKDKTIVEKVKPLIFDSTLHTAAVIKDTTVNSTNWFTYRIKQGSLKSMKIQVPAETEIISVTGTNIFNWNREGNVLSVRLETAYSDTYNLTINALQPLPPSVQKDESICSVSSSLKGFITDSASSEKGYVALRLSDEGELVSSTGVKLTRIDPSELKGRLQHQKFDVALKFIAPGWEMPFSVVRRKQVETSKVTVSTSTSLVRLISNGPVLVKQSWTLTNSGEQFLPVSLPGGSALLSCFVKGKPTDTGFAKDSETLKIPLIKSDGQAGSYSTFKVEITYASYIDSPGLYGTFKVPLARIPYLVRSAVSTVIGPSGYVINDGKGTMDCENVNSLSRWYRKVAKNPLGYFLQPAGIILLAPLAPLMLTSKGGSVDGLLMSKQSFNQAPMAEVAQDQVTVGDAYGRPQKTELREKEYDKNIRFKSRANKKLLKRPRAPQRMEEQKAQLAGGFAQEDMDMPQEAFADIRDVGTGMAAPEPAREVSKSDRERARFIATMKKSSGSKGNLPVRIDIDRSTSGNRLTFSQELLFTDDKAGQTIRIFYVKDFVVPMVIFVNILLCFFIALFLYQRLSDGENVTNLLMYTVVILIADMWFMHLLPDVNLLDHSLYTFYGAIPVHFVRLLDLRLTKIVARFRAKRKARILSAEKTQKIETQKDNSKD